MHDTWTSALLNSMRRASERASIAYFVPPVAPVMTATRCGEPDSLGMMHVFRLMGARKAVLTVLKRTWLLFANILVPNLRMVGDEAFQQFTAVAVVEIDHLDAILAQPLDPAGERPALAHDDRADSELPDQPAAVPARR